MPNTEFAAREFDQRIRSNIEKGKEYYQEIAKEVEAKYLHQFIVINTKTGGYLVSPNDLDVLKRAREKFYPDPMYFRRVGEPSAAYSFGG